MMIEEGIVIRLYVDQNALWLYDMAFIDLPVGLGDSECIRHLYVVMCVYRVCWWLLVLLGAWLAGCSHFHCVCSMNLMYVRV